MRWETGGKEEDEGAMNDMTRCGGMTVMAPDVGYETLCMGPCHGIGFLMHVCIAGIGVRTGKISFIVI
jgi:hypothetical protein